MDTKQKNRTFEDLIAEAHNLHSREISDLMSRVQNWKERFESLVNQKHSYKDEILKLRQENYSHKEEIRKLEEQIRTGQNRSNVTCVSCDSLRKSMETVEVVYQRSLDEKDKIIEFLEKRLMELTHGKSIIGNTTEGYSTPNKTNDLSLHKNRRPSTGKKQSPDSTCSNEIQKDDRSPDHDQSSQSNKTSGKLKLSKRNKKRKNKYTEDPSPEQKRMKVSCDKQNPSNGMDVKVKERSSNEVRAGSVEKTGTKPSVFVPETLDLCQDYLEDETPIPDQNLPNKMDTKEKEKDRQSKMTVPETVAMEICDTDSTSESELNVTVKEKKVYNLQAMLESPPSGVDNSDDDEDDMIEKKAYVNHNTLNLSGVSIRSDSDSSGEEILTVRKVKPSDNNHSETENLNANKKNMQSTSDSDTKSDSSDVSSSKHSVTQNFKLRSVSRSSKNSDSSLPRSGKNSYNSFPFSPVFGGASNKKDDVMDVVNSPSVLRNLPTVSDSELESPLLLRYGVSSSQEIEKSDSNPFGKLVRGHTFPPTGKSTFVLDLDIGDVMKVTSGENADRSGFEKHGDDSAQTTRQTRNSQSRMSRSQETVSDKRLEQVQVSRSKSVSSVNPSPNKRENLRNLKEEKSDKLTEDGSVNEGRVLRQTTLSQVFRNSPRKSKYGSSAKGKSKEEQDLQKAIELSLRENQAIQEIGDEIMDNTIRKEKENTPPFKKPTTPRKVRVLSQPSKSPRRNPNRKCKPESQDLDETVSLSSLESGRTSYKFKQYHKSDEKMQQKSLISPERFNGSLDPAIELSQLCADSEPQGDQHVNKKKNDIPVNHSPEESAIFISPVSNIAALHDFTLRDLHNNKHRGVLTSTCIEDDSEAIPSSLRSIKFGHGIKRNLQLVKNYSEDIADVDDDDDDVVIDKDTVDCSFDRIPRKNEPEFAHVEVVRKQDERRKLKGHKCKECIEYYQGMDLNETEKQNRIQACSKHRAKYGAPDTPEHFWSIHFLNTPDLEDKGYAHKEEKMKPSLHRRRVGLRKMFKSKTEEEQENAQDSQKDYDVSDLDF